MSESEAQELSDLELMAAIRAGRPDALEALVRRHQQPLLNFFRRLGAHSDGEDLVQETFLRVFRYRFSYRPTAKFTTFLYTIARHAWADGMRKAKRREALAEQTAAVASASDEGAAQRRTHARMDVQAALELLPEKLRTVVVMSLYQGLRYEEIAAILDVPLGTVKSRMFFALKRLKETLDG